MVDIFACSPQSVKNQNDKDGLLSSSEKQRHHSDGVHESSSAASMDSNKSSPISSPKPIVKDTDNFFLNLQKDESFDSTRESSPTSLPSGIFSCEEKLDPDKITGTERSQEIKRRSLKSISPIDFVRKLVSKNKKRYHDKHLNVKLDLSYIESRIIAMGYPADSPFEKLYRNSIDEVEKFLNQHHKGRYMIYNLCSETNRVPSNFLDQNQNPGTGYDIHRFNCRVKNFGFKDHCPPNFDLTVEFCKHALDWLNQHEDNVLAIHCKAGKGRTGVMICCLMIYLSAWLGQHYSTTTAEREKLTWTTEQAMQHYAEKRTKDGKGVTIPSQIRYIRYFEAWMRWDLKYVPDFKATFLRLDLINLPQIYRDGLFFEISILQDGRYKCVHASEFESTEWRILDENFYNIDDKFKPIKRKQKISKTLPLPTVPCLSYEPRDSKTLQGHVQVEFFKQGDSKPLFSMYFHTFFQSLPPEYQRQLNRDTETYRIDTNEDGKKYFTPIIYPVPQRGDEEHSVLNPLKDERNYNLSTYIGNSELSAQFPIKNPEFNVTSETQPVRSISQHTNRQGYGAWFEREGKRYRIHEANRKWGSTQRTVCLSRDELDQFSKDTSQQRKFSNEFKVVITLQDTESQVMSQDLLLNRIGRVCQSEEVSREQIHRKELLENRRLESEICQNESFKKRK